ncbi:hypothetical protein OQA88_5667 [Cercophora sp. LCS_1]
MSPSTTAQRHSWRSHPRFIVCTVGIGQFSDFFLFGMRVPLLPYLVRSHLGVPESQVQPRVAALLASFSIATLVSAVPAGWLADRNVGWRGRLYLFGLAALFWSTITFYTSEHWGMMVFSRVLNGVSAAVLYAAGFAMVADAVAPGDLGKSLGLVGFHVPRVYIDMLTSLRLQIRSIVAVGDLIGPPLGGVIFSHWGFEGILNVSVAVLVVDLILRLLMVKSRYDDPAERKQPVVVGYGPIVHGEGEADSGRFLPGAPGPSNTDPHAGPRNPLPILACLSDKQLLTALFLSFVQYIILGSYDATLALEASTRFELPPKEVGVIFLALAIPVLSFSPIAGWAVDRYGPRLVAISGYGLFALTLASIVLLELGSGGPTSLHFVAFYFWLVVQGLCLAMVSTPSVVKAKQAVECAVKQDPARFGSRGATGQMFGLNTLVSSFGLLVGNSASASLRETLEYEGLNAVLAGFCMVAAGLAWTFFGEEQERENSEAV